MERFFFSVPGTTIVFLWVGALTDRSFLGPLASFRNKARCTVQSKLNRVKSVYGTTNRTSEKWCLGVRGERRVTAKQWNLWKWKQFNWGRRKGQFSLLTSCSLLFGLQVCHRQTSCKVCLYGGAGAGVGWGVVVLCGHNCRHWGGGGPTIPYESTLARPNERIKFYYSSASLIGNVMGVGKEWGGGFLPS